MLGADEIEIISEATELLSENLDLEEAKLEHIAVLHVLCAYRNRESGLCNPSKETLAKVLRISERTIYTLLDELREMGAISWTSGGKKKGGGHCSNSYTLDVFEQHAKIRAEQQKIFDYSDAMHDCYENTLSEQEKQAFHEWNDNRPRLIGTDDWPGWEQYIGVRPRSSAAKLATPQGYEELAIAWCLELLSAKEKQELEAWEAAGNLLRHWPGWVKWIGPAPVEEAGDTTRQPYLPSRRPEAEGGPDTTRQTYLPSRSVQASETATRQNGSDATRQIEPDATRQIDSDATRQICLPRKQNLEANLEAKPRSKTFCSEPEKPPASELVNTLTRTPQEPEPITSGRIVGEVLDSIVKSYGPEPIPDGPPERPWHREEGQSTIRRLEPEPAQEPEPARTGGRIVGRVLDSSPSGKLCYVEDEHGMQQYDCLDPALQGIVRAAFENKCTVALTYEVDHVLRPPRGGRTQRGKRPIRIITSIEEKHERAAGTISTAATA